MSFRVDSATHVRRLDSETGVMPVTSSRQTLRAEIDTAPGAIQQPRIEDEGLPAFQRVVHIWL